MRIKPLKKDCIYCNKKKAVISGKKPSVLIFRCDVCNRVWSAIINENGKYVPKRTKNSK